MAECHHHIADKETAVADGMCPMCLGDENAILMALIHELANDLEAEIQVRAKGELPRRIERDMKIVQMAREALK